MAEEFRNQHGKLKSISASLAQAEALKICVKEIDICNASRPIKASEAEAAKKNNIAYTEVPVAL